MAKVKVRGKGSVYKMERGKSRGKCRKWQLRAEIDGEFEGDEGYVKTRVFHGTYSEAQDAKDEFVAAIERGEVRRERGMLFPAYAEAWLAERAAKVAYDTLQKNRCHIVCANMHLSKARIEEIRPGRAPGCDVQGPQKRREPFRQALVRNLRARHIRDAPQDVPGCGEGGDADSNPCEYAEPPAIDTEQHTPLPSRASGRSSIPSIRGSPWSSRFGRRSGRA